MCGLVDHPQVGLDGMPWPDNEKVYIAIDKREYDRLAKEKEKLYWKTRTQAKELDILTESIRKLKAKMRKKNEI